MKLCECGCGNPAPIAKRNRAKGNWIKGQPLRFIHGHNGRGKGQPILTGPQYLVDPITGCWEWQRCQDEKGYGIMKSNGRNIKAHRYFFEKHIGKIPMGLQLDHLCRNPSCVNPDHLEPVTNAENCRRGNNAKLTKKDVRAIQAELQEGTTQTQIAKKFNVSNSCINFIATERAWT